MKEQIIQQGAEAVLIRRGSEVLKRRVEKGYRLKELDDKIRKLRTRGEGKILEKAGKIVAIPKVKKVDEKAGEIEMEFIDGLKLSENLDELKNWKEVCERIGENIAKLHDAGIIHGDLTTSNMIYVDEENLNRITSSAHPPAGKSGSNFEVYFIDFGLGFQNGRIEDKAVDLYLIKEAFEAKHFKRFEEYFKAVLEGYKISENFKETLTRLKKVEKRGRYKAQY
ncbi:MAG: Kae1-associated serine/threonine protein kinase [Nanoarchaeota archaeon]|nr:Kae1-associated serine/threonine protein kinase [Nanoarchaeota archaeon]